MDKSGKTQQFEQLLSMYVEQQSSSQLSNMLEVSILSKMQEESAARVIIHFVNKQLATAVNRYKGVTLLDKVVMQCPFSLLIDNAVSWINVCVNSNSKEPVSITKLNVLGKILLLCSGTPDFNKAVVTLLPKIIDMCLSNNPNSVLSERSLECLKICLQKYSSSCGPFKSKIESFLLQYITSHVSSSTMRKVGSVFHYLQQAGGSGVDGITHRNNWCNQLTRLCSTMHKLYNQFFESVTEFEYVDMDVPSFELSIFTKRSESSVPYFTAGVLKNIVIVMNSMLIEHFPVEKSISIPHILNVIKRGLVVDTFIDFNNSIDETQFAALLYIHQIDLLYLLRFLIACFKQNLMPYSFTITKLLTDCLQRTQKDYFRNSSEYQKAVLRVLKYWVIIAGNKLSSAIHNKLVTLIISYATPAQSTVTLCLNQSQTKKKGKGKKRTIQETTLETNANLVKETEELLKNKEIVCTEALSTGKVLLQYVMLQLDQDTYKLLSETIIQHILNIQSGKLVQPYSNSKCQENLYEMLVSILMQPTFCVSPILQVAINVFTRGQTRAVNFSRDEVFQICSKGLNVLEKLCHPICPTLRINQDASEDLAGDKNWKITLETEEDNINVSDHISSPIIEPLGKENQNMDNPTYTTQISTQDDNLTLGENVHILNVQIIKHGSSSSMVSNITKTSAPDADLNEEMDFSECEMQDLNIEASEANLNTEIKETTKEGPIDNSFPNDKTIKCKKEAEELEENKKEIQTDFELNIVDEKPLKDSESMILDNEEENMLNSFNDIVNQE